MISKASMSAALSVTWRNCCVRWPTRPASMSPSLPARTATTRIGSLNARPLKICPSLIAPGGFIGAAPLNS